jgi:hypothetical protein
MDNQPNQPPPAPNPDQLKGDRYPFWLVLIAITVIWAGVCSLDGQRFPIEMFLIGWVFGVVAWSFFCFAILNESKNFLQGLGGIAVFFWPITIAIMIWVIRAILKR